MACVKMSSVNKTSSSSYLDELIKFIDIKI